MNRTRNRKSTRLAGYDYRRPGLYFVTVCTQDRACVFGEVVEGVMRRSALGEVAHEEWERTLALRLYLVPDVFVVMPNHVHLLCGLTGADVVPTGDVRRDVETPRRDAVHGVPTPSAGDAPSANDTPSVGGTSSGDGGRRFGQHLAGSVSSIVGAYKAAVTRQARRAGVWGPGALWQGRFHDRIVRDAREADRIRRYIAENPLRWHLDRYAP